MLSSRQNPPLSHGKEQCFSMRYQKTQYFSVMAHFFWSGHETKSMGGKLSGKPGLEISARAHPKYGRTVHVKKIVIASKSWRPCY